MAFLDTIKNLIKELFDGLYTLGRVEKSLEQMLSLSTAHMPSEKPDFGSFRVVEHEYGYIVFVMDPEVVMIPDWLDPIMDVASMEECTLILFDNACGKSRSFETWDW
jgi:hypothetical protein